MRAFGGCRRLESSLRTAWSTHLALGPDGSMRVSEIWDSLEQMQAFGDRLIPILTDIGIEFSGEPEIIEVYNIISR